MIFVIHTWNLCATIQSQLQTGSDLVDLPISGSPDLRSGRLDWWRNWEPEWENKTHATALLNNEALRLIFVIVLINLINIVVKTIHPLLIIINSEITPPPSLTKSRSGWSIAISTIQRARHSFCE